MLTLAWAAPAHASAGSVPVPFPAVDGGLSGILVSGDTAYLGGTFDGVGVPAGPLAVFGLDGAVRQTFPQITNRFEQVDFELPPPTVQARPAPGAGEEAATYGVQAIAATSG